MTLLIVLIILFILSIAFFVCFPFVKRNIIFKKYNSFCTRKVKAIAKKYNLRYLTDINLYTFNNENIGINSILFGKKYIYIMSNYYMSGDIEGNNNFNSWTLKKRRGNGVEYIDNISNQLSEKTRVFSIKFGIDSELIMPIAIVNNDCEIKVNGINQNNTFIIHFSSFKKLIENLEKRNLVNLNEDQVELKYETIKNENR